MWGRQTVYGQNTVYLCLSKYIVFENTHAQQRACDNCGQRNGGRSCCLMDRVVNRVVRVTTAASETEGVAAVSWIESLMIRRPLGSIDPNSIRETELHTESRRRHSRGERESYTARSFTGRGMLLVRGLPLRVGGRPMRHGQKGACVLACVCVIASLQI